MTPRYVYIIELKFDCSAADALVQIKEKRYAYPYANGTRRIFLIGINFCSKTRHIGAPVIEGLS